MKLYLRYFKIQLSGQMQYKASFWMTVLGQFLVSFTALLSISFLFSRFHQVEGFSFGEVLICFAAVTMAFSLSECFARGFDTFASLLGNGTFDRILVRPRGLVFQVLANRMDFTRLGKLVQALAVLIYAIPASGVQWTPGRIGVFCLMILSGVAVFSGLFLLFAAASFFTTQGLEVFNIFTDGGREFASYPLAIYGEGVLKLCTYVVPLALVQYYPLLYLIGRSDQIGYALSPLGGFAFLPVCYAVWRLGLRHFKSTGS